MKSKPAAMTRSMAVEYASRNVRVNAVAPAATRTERVIALAEANAHIDDLVRQGQLFGWCEPMDIARMGSSARVPLGKGALMGGVLRLDEAGKPMTCVVYVRPQLVRAK